MRGAAFWAVAALAGSAAWAQPSLRFDAYQSSVVAAGLEPEQLRALVKTLAGKDTSLLRPVFGVFLENAQLAILGDYEISERAVRFVPRFPLLGGRSHRVKLDVAGLYRLSGLTPPAGASVLEDSFVPPLAPPAEPKTIVTKVFPSAGIVPANILRFYIHFSNPMTRRGIARHIRLEDATGKPVEHAFLEMEDGLWDPESRRLTVFLHPGRIKRGLALHEREGPPLRSGKKYRLIVDKKAEDEEGKPLVSEFVKEFETTDEDRRVLDVAKWTIREPAAGSADTLTVTSDKPLDEALFARLLQIETAGGRVIGGEAKVEAGETRWGFAPFSKWTPGDYLLRVAAEVEDVAGNRPTRLFDEPVDPAGKRVEAREVTLRFTIR